MFVQATKSKRNGKTYVSYLVRESFRTSAGPRSRTVCNITRLPPDVRDMISGALAGNRLVAEDAIELHDVLDCGGLAVLVETWQQLRLDELLAEVGTPRERSLIQAMVFSRLLFPCAKLALKERAAGSLLAAACGLPAQERFDEDELYAAMDSITGHWCALEKALANEAFKEPVSLVLYDLTSVYFEGDAPVPLGRYGHSRDHRPDRPQVILAVATDTHGAPLHLSVLRGNRADQDKLVEIEHDKKRYVIAGGPWRRQRDQERRAARIAKAEAALEKLAAAKRRKPDAQKIASQAGRTLQSLKAHKYFSYRVDAGGILRWERKQDIIAAESAHDGWYLLHTNLIASDAEPAQVQGHYKNLLEVEEAFCELKSYLRVRPVFHYRPDRVINHIRICFLAYWISARLATQWRARGERGEVTRILRQLQTIRLGKIHIANASLPDIARFTQVPPALNALLQKLDLLHLFAAPPKWAQTQPL